MKWFRLYDELVDDPKMILLPADIFRNVIFLWCVASQNDGYLPPVEAVAVKLRLPVAKARKLLANLKSSGLLDEHEGRLQPHNWNGRQYKSDGPSTARVKRFRGRNKDDPGNGPGNGDETFHETEKKRPETVHETTKKRPQSQKTESDPESQNHQHPPEIVAAPARGQSLVSPEAIRIADELGQDAGFTKETWPVGWCGAAMAIQKWLNDGCPGEVVKLAVNTALARKRDAPPDNFSYFARPIAAAFADYLRPNPTAPPQAFDGKSNGNSTHKRTVIDAGRDLVANLQALDRAADTGGAASDPAPRLLPPH